MNRFIRELRRREVFRTAGLYIGVCWILIEASSVMLPTFDAPEWILRWIIIGAVVGFPIMLVLAWIYDVTARGIEVQPDATDTVIAPIGSRKMDFVVIGVLSVALVFSVYMNITAGPSVVEEPDPVSVLIADFDNQTGNPLFDGLLEQAFIIGIESAPHITSYQRNEALKIAGIVQPGAEALDATVSRLVAVREGIQLVLSGVIAAAGSGFELQVVGVDPKTSEPVFDVDSEAASSEAVLQALGELSRDVREELGDTTLEQSAGPKSETFTAASLEAAKAYTNAQQLAFEGRLEDAVEHYRVASELDPNFGRAFSSWALAEFKLGRTEEATELWEKALSLMETMTERERLRTLGLYYASVTRNYESAVQTFRELAEKYPADTAGHNNYAVSAFQTLDFETATEAGRRLLDIYPGSDLYRSNFALYAMYAGEFEAAATVAQDLIKDNPGYGTSYLPVAIAHLAAGEYDAARAAYEAMANAETSEHKASLATLGLADIAIFQGDFSSAEELLWDGIEKDIDADNRRAAAVKYVALAESFSASGDHAAAVSAAREALALSTSNAVQVSAAQVLLDAGEIDAARQIGAELGGKLQPQSRAFGRMLEGSIARIEGDYVNAVDLQRSAIELADLWLIRFELGRTFLEAEFYAEALSEFGACEERVGEASAVFLDDQPTWRRLASLPYWSARAQQGLGMHTSSIEGFQEFIDRRPQGGPLADDARQRLNR
jgi:tetratricopeptide (TPR) repeat protein